MELEFINVTPSGDTVGVDPKNRRRIRSHVQREFRRKEHQKKTTCEISLRIGKPLESDEPQDSTAVLLPAPYPSPGVWSPTVYRTQYLQSIADSWFPIANTRYATMVKTIVDTFYTHGGPVNASVDAMKLLHVGTLAKDDRLVLEARKRCLYVINGLRLDISRRHPRMGLATTLLLGLGILMIEIYSAYANTSSWQSQVIGMSAMIAGRPRNKMDSILENFALPQTRMLQLVQTLHARKPFPKNLAIPVIPTHSLLLDSLLDLAFEIPCLLQAADSTMAEEPRQPETELIARLSAQEKALLTWLKWFNASKHHGPSDQQSESSTPLFDLTSESLCLTCLLLVTESLEDLKSFGKSESSSLALEPSRRCATALRQTTVLLAEAAGAPLCKARTVSGPLHFLGRYYARVGDADGLRWCVGFRSGVEKEVPYLHWHALIPWSLMTLTWVPT